MSHTDFAATTIGNHVLLFGGQVFKHPEQYYLKLTNAIQAYDIDQDRWSVAGYLPNTLKVPVVGTFNDSVFVTAGQRGVHDQESPGPITDDTWRTGLSALVAKTAVTPSQSGALAGKTILMISHDLSRSGSPLLLMETARALADRGANVRVATVSDDAKGWNVASDFRVPLVPIELAIEIARSSDVVLANTLSKPTETWVRRCLAEYPASAGKLAWWVHEIDIEYYLSGADVVGRAAIVIFDSEASRQAWAGVVQLPDSHVVHPALTDEFVRIAAAWALPFPRDPTSVEQSSAVLTRQQIREHLELSSEDFLLCSIGGYSKRKGQRMLIQTAAKAARRRGLPVKLVIVGLPNGEERRALLKHLSKDEKQILSPSRVYVTQADYASFYLASDAFVLNTQGETGRGECYGRVTMEALAFGLPVLGTNAGGTPEIIDDGKTGLLFPVGIEGQAKLAECINVLVQDRTMAKRFGAAGRRAAAYRFAEQRFLGQFESALSRFW